MARCISEIGCHPGDLKKLLQDARDVSQSMDLLLGASKGFSRSALSHAQVSGGK